MTALTPYGLSLNVQQSPNDATTGRLLEVGKSFGLGSAGAGNTYDLWPSTSLDDVNVPCGMYYVNGTIEGRPTAGTGIILHRQAGSAGGQLFETDAGELFHRGRRFSVYTS